MLTDISSPLPVDIIDVEVEVKLFGSGVLTSLLVLLSFKLRRRTGFLRIRLKYRMILMNYINNQYLLKTRFSFTKVENR